ncbi:hypothetical protein, partial [Paramuribaculum intestinale]|uniref:hypothetical protein n=1 Tax=Paramuribaculum intestinale TaxID=2094151 RepID=UPI002637C8B6
MPVVFAICDESECSAPRTGFADMRSRLMREYISVAISALVIFCTALNMLSFRMQSYEFSMTLWHKKGLSLSGQT